MLSVCSCCGSRDSVPAHVIFPQCGLSNVVEAPDVSQVLFTVVSVTVVVCVVVCVLWCVVCVPVDALLSVVPVLVVPVVETVAEVVRLVGATDVVFV